jgi:hypothetical protein
LLQQLSLFFALLEELELGNDSSDRSLGDDVYLGDVEHDEEKM